MDRAEPIDHAVVLAAGNGDRFHSHPPRSKLLATIGGMPLLVRTLTAAFEAGVRNAHVILGYDADCVRAAAIGGAPPHLTLSFHMNDQWRQENGLSLLAARPFMNGSPFALLMGDHLFDPAVLKPLLSAA